MTERIDLPSGGWAEFVTPEELTYRQEEVLRKAATALYLERVRYAAEQGIAREEIPTYPTQAEMMALDLGPFERSAAGALCVGWSHSCPPPSADPARTAWMDDVPRADVRAVLVHAVMLTPQMTGTEEGATPGAPFDGSSTSPTSSTTPSPPTPTPTTTPPSGTGDSSPSLDGPSTSSTPPPPAAVPTSS